MIALAWTLGSIAAYFAIGWRVAVWDMPYLYARLRNYREYDEIKSQYLHRRVEVVYNETAVRNRAYSASTATLLFWPFRLPYLAMARQADVRDPKRLEQEIAERDAKIAEMERKYLT